jgi:hypothetical protein
MTDHDPTAVARQLEALGEAPPSPAELSAEATLDDDVDVASVAALIALSRPLDEADAGPLSEMEQARAWRKFEARRGDETPARDQGGGAARRPWALIATGLAAAAVVAFVLVRPGTGAGTGDESQHEMAMAMGEQARVGLKTLGVEPGSESARARDMLADYEARLNRPDEKTGANEEAG